ncbi:MAG: hypothetical protein V1816_25545, partial [Pseudomonadota bacterium]
MQKALNTHVLQTDCLENQIAPERRHAYSRSKFAPQGGGEGLIFTHILLRMPTGRYGGRRSIATLLKKSILIFFREEIVEKNLNSLA